MKKGITATSIAIMLTIIILLLGTITVSSYNSIQNAKKIVFSLEISNIQEEVNSYMASAEEGEYPILDGSYVINLSNITESIKEVQFNGESPNANNQITLYELDLSELGIDDVQYGRKKTSKDVYVFSKDTKKVYYLEGVKFGNNTYYTLTQDLIDIKEENEKTEASKTYDAPTITTNAFVVNTDSTNNKKIYLTNIKVEGEEVTTVKYERELINEENAYEYFQTNGKTLISDRIEVKEGEYITLYAENSSGDWSIRHEGMCNIPEDFYYVGGSIPTGVVISDSASDANKGTAINGNVVSAGLDGNQFVWIPVDDMDKFVREDGHTSGGGQTYVQNGNAVELYTRYTVDNDPYGYYAEHMAMLDSVEKYKGFYIGRYETGDAEIEEPRTAYTAKHDIVIKKDQYVYNYVNVIDSTDYPGAITLSRGLYNGDQYSVVSHLITGVEWDATLKFIYTINPDYKYRSNNIGWYASSYKEGNPKRKTGIDKGTSSDNMLHNIYDMAGNHYELTSELLNGSYCVRGGASYVGGSDYPISRRDVVTSGPWVGFRISLYIK